MSRKNIAVFFDVQNLYHASKMFGGNKICYKALMAKISEGSNVSMAVAYAAHRNIRSSRSFYKALEDSGISVVSRPVHVKKTNGNSRVISQHFDVEMSVDAMTTPEEVDTVILCSGNGNFSYLVRRLKEQEIAVEVWSFRDSTAESLRNECSKFVEIPKDCLLQLTHTDTIEVN
jgi:uncharacterized LabA/DUF88 family protein